MPVVTTASGKGVFAETHPLALGVFGTFGIAAANAAVAEADVIIVAGSKLGASDTARENPALLDPTRQSFIQIDVEPRNASWTFPAEHVLIGDAGATLDQLREALGRRRRRAPKAAGAASRRSARRNGYFDTPEYGSDKAPIMPQRVIGELRKHLPDDVHRHLRRGREPHPDDPLLPDPRRRRLPAGGGRRADGLRHPRRAGGQAGASGAHAWRRSAATAASP